MRNVIGAALCLACVLTLGACATSVPAPAVSTSPSPHLAVLDGPVDAAAPTIDPGPAVDDANSIRHLARVGDVDAYVALSGESQVCLVLAAEDIPVTASCHDIGSFNQDGIEITLLDRATSYVLVADGAAGPVGSVQHAENLWVTSLQ